MPLAHGCISGRRVSSVLVRIGHRSWLEGRGHDEKRPWSKPGATFSLAAMRTCGGW